MVRLVRVLVLATALAIGTGTAQAKADPLESFNRAVFAFNNHVVDHVIDPISGFLDAWIPTGLRQAGGNLYANLTEPEFIITNLFSGYRDDAMISAGRFAVNLTLGLGGVFDPATGLGLVRRETEFGESLCALGVPATPYIVLPLIGPANVWSAGLLTSFFAVEWYALSLISSVLATADLVVDISASAASLRHAAEQPDLDSHDPYAVQRGEYFQYIDKGCQAASPKGASHPMLAIN